MNEIIIYGASTSRYEYLKYKLESFIEENDLDVELKEVKEVSRLIEDKIESIPTLRINSHVNLVYNHQEGIEEFFETAKSAIISEMGMDKLNRILVPIDFSETSLNAFKYAKDMAAKGGAFIDLLHVHHPSPILVEGAVVEERHSDVYLKKALVNIAKKNTVKLNNDQEESESLHVNPVYTEGLASGEIIKRSKEADLIIMGTTGESERLKKLLGSVSEKTAIKAFCPVLLIPEDAKYKGIKQIVYAYNPTSYDQRVIKELSKISIKNNATIHLVHVDDGSPYEEYDINTYLAHMYDDVDFRHSIIKSPNVSEGINEFSSKVDADLIVVSKRKKRLAEKLFQNSITKSTLRRTSFPIMVFHMEDHECRCGGNCPKNLIC